MVPRFSVLALAALALAACGSVAATDPGNEQAGQPTSGDDSITQVQPASTVAMSNVTSGPAGPPGEVVQPAPGIPNPQKAQVARAIQALADRLGIAAADVTPVAVTPVEWNDSSLGCPAPDQMYTQVITPGFQIVLAAGGQEYTYHADERSRVVLCMDGQPAGG